MPPSESSAAPRIPCPHGHCNRLFQTAAGLKHHRTSIHNFSFDPRVTNPTENSFSHSATTNSAPGVIRNYHDKLMGNICDVNGQPITPDAPSPPASSKSTDDWSPYGSKLHFETAEYLFQQAEMLTGNIDQLCELWRRSLHADESSRNKPPFRDHKELYETIDTTQLGDVTWKSFKLKFNGERPEGSVPAWMDQTYEFWYRPAYSLIAHMLSNTDFHGGFDYVPYRDFLKDGEQRQYENFMSGDWSWKQADKIAEVSSTAGSTFIPIILGSDKTMVSVATGQNDYWPVYLSIGNIHNNIRRAHRSGVQLLAFLAISKAAKKHTDNPAFRLFKKQLFHVAMSKILVSLKPGMTTPQVMRCSDQHFRHIIFGLGPYIADYPEQVLVSGIVQNWCARCIAYPTDLDGGGGPRTAQLTQALVDEFPLGVLWDEWGVDGMIIPFTDDFPRADIRQLLAPDILHQLIKGTFKDHLLDWIEKYLELEFSKAGAKDRLTDIDRRIATAPPFPGLRRFPDGRGFSQWTGNDSKALMKVYLPAIEGHVPDDIIRTIRAFLEFCYIVRRNIITDDTLLELKDALNRFHQYRTIFEEIGVRPNGFSLPHQHSLTHYEGLIRLFGVPNGLCSSITESKHITAVKEPWRRSNKHHTIGQILHTNQRLSQLVAARADFEARGMLPVSRQTNPPSSNTITNSQVSEDGDLGTEEDPYIGILDERPGLAHSDVKLAHSPARKRVKNALALAIELGIPSLPTLIGTFLSEQLQAAPTTFNTSSHHPPFMGHIKIFHLATATFVAPSDPSGIGSMRHEHICATPSWYSGSPRYNCIFVSTSDMEDGMLSMDVGRVYCFFSFTHTNGQIFQCTLVHWFDRLADEPDSLTGMWMVTPSFLEDGSNNFSVIHVDSIVHLAHLLPIFRDERVPDGINFHNSLDIYRGFYVNRFADHHAFELAS